MLYRKGQLKAFCLQLIEPSIFPGGVRKSCRVADGLTVSFSWKSSALSMTRQGVLNTDAAVDKYIEETIAGDSASNGSDQFRAPAVKVVAVWLAWGMGAMAWSGKVLPVRVAKVAVASSGMASAAETGWLVVRAASVVEAGSEETEMAVAGDGHRGGQILPFVCGA